MKKTPTQTIIGRAEFVNFPAKAVQAVPARIDTGAYRSSVHISSIKEYTKNGKKNLHFQLLGHPAYPEECGVETTEFSTIVVRSSNGHQAKRYAVNLKISLGGKTFTTSFTLSERSKNVFPVLVGRQALRKRFLVDSGKTGIPQKELRAIASSPKITQVDEEEVR